MPRSGAASQPEREEALLVFATDGRMMRSEPRHVAALADLCDEDGEDTLALLLLSRAKLSFGDGE